MDQNTSALIGIVSMFVLVVLVTIQLHRTQRHVKQAHETIDLQNVALNEVTTLFVNELSLNVRLENHHEEHIAQRAKDIERITKADLRWARATEALAAQNIDLDVVLTEYEVELANLPEPSEEAELEPSVIGEQLAALLKREIAEEEKATVKDIFAIADAVNENMD